MDEEKNILCVDDDDIARYLLKEFLDRIGNFQLVQLDNGKACIDYISQHYVDLIILDFHLGDMTGEQVCSEIPVKVLTRWCLLLSHLLSTPVISNSALPDAAICLKLPRNLMA